MSLANFVQVTLSAAATASQTTLTVATPLGGYTLPPSDGGTLVLTDSPGAPTKFEIVTYASRTGTGPCTLTGVTRGVEGTTGAVWGIGAYVVQSITAEGYTAGLAAKEPVITAGTSTQMWLGNKTWASVLSQVQGTLLTGLSLATGTAITAADTVLSGLGKLQKQISDAATNLASDVRGTVLTGLSLTTGTAVAAADTVLVAVGKLQKQVTDAGTNLAANVRATAITGYVVGSNAALAATDTVLGALGKIQGQLNGKQASLGYTAENTANKGVANGYAGLDATGKVPAIQLPSFVDDVLEFANLAGFPATGESGKIYVDLATNKSHRWSGSVYVEISASPGSTDAVTEGGSNLYFTEGRVRATLLAGYAVGANAVLAAGDSVLGAFGKVQGQINDIVTGLAADVRAVILTGYAVGSNTALAATDTVLGAMGKLQGQINAAATNLQADVRATVLTGYSVGANAVLAAGDSVLGALQKLQGQINNKQATHANLAALSGLAGAADKLPYFTGAGALSVATLTAKARGLLASTDEAAMRTFLGLNTAAVAAVTTSAYDTTAGRVLKVGDYGLGGFTSALTAAQLDGTKVGGAVSTAGEGWSPYSSILTLGYHTAGYATQISSTQGINYPHLSVRNLNANVWGPIFTLMHTGNILAPVSQSGGLPTGGIIERGSNANGEYTKFADGTLICKRVNAEYLALDQVYGPATFYNSISWTFPAAFVGPIPTCTGSGSIASRIVQVAANNGVNLTASNYFVTDGAGAAGAGTYTFALLAIGRWY